MTISSATVTSQSGLRFGEIKSSPGLRGPLHCYFRYTGDTGGGRELHFDI